jgi:hypothetical protein
MTDQPENERIRIGANFPPLPEQIAESAADLPEAVTDYLRGHYDGRVRQLDELLDRAAAIPAKIEDDETMGIAAKVVKEIGDLDKALESARETEKAPYYRASQAADNFFFALRDKLLRRAKGNRPGVGDVLKQRIDAWNQAKLAREQEARRLAAEQTAREAAAKAAAEDAARKKADEDRLAAERARKPETQAAKEAVAGLSESQAAEATAQAGIAAEQAREAHLATLAKPADLVRQRVEDGPTVTMRREPYAEVEDFALLDASKLWPFVSNSEKEKALRAWAKVNNWNAQMPGAAIGHRNVTAVR